MPTYGYNFPWSGRLGRVAERCHHCGTAGPYFQISSHSQRCARCRPGMPEIPQIAAETNERYERLARQWCGKRGIDYEATVANYLKHLGPPEQERDSPIPGVGQDFTVYFESGAAAGGGE